jgi:hypothetical protein
MNEKDQILTTKNSQQEQTNETLRILFSSAARVAVLRVFMLDPGRGYYQRQLEAATGVPIRGVQRELDRLASVSLLYAHREGNRTYYQVDMDHALFPELRSMVLKTSGDADRIRGRLAVDPAVRLAFLRREEREVLVVLAPGANASNENEPGFSIDVVSSEFFVKRLAERPESLAVFLKEGEDLLGRREDVLWRRIEAAGFDVKKGRGVP